MKKVTSILFLCLTSMYVLVAQDIVLQAEYPAVVQEGQQFNITWSVNTNGGDFVAPSFDGFYKLMGPSTSFSSSTQIINGKVNRSITNSFSFILQAQKAGTYTIPAATYKVKNDTYSSEPFTIEVVPGNSQASTSSSNNPNGQSSTNNQVTTSQNPNVTGQVYLDFLVNKKEVYVGEHIVGTAKIYTKVNLSGINEVKYPAFTGFMKTDLETPQLTSLLEENVNGTIYGTGVLQQFLLYPQMAGEIVIDPMQVTALQQQRVNSGIGFDSFFDDFFSSYQTVPVVVASKPVTIKVKPLPSNRPSDFSGIVGKLSMKSSIDKDTVNVNDAVSYQVTISGSGNLKIAGSPNLNLSPDIEIYDPKITDNLKNDASGTSGSRTFEYLLIPRHYGDYTIPSITYSFFNTSTGKYEQLSTPEYQFYANKVDEQGSSSMMVYGGVSKEDVKYMGQDIRFIKTDAGKLSKLNGMFAESGAFYSIYGFLSLLFLTILFVRREHVRRNADITAVKNRKAGKVAAKRLKVASDCLKNSEIDKFYEELLKALWGYLSDKLFIPLSTLNRSNIVDTLKEKGVQEDKITDLTSIIDTCEFARYAPSASEAEATEVYDKAAGFINFLERTI